MKTAGKDQKRNKYAPNLRFYLFSPNMFMIQLLKKKVFMSRPFILNVWNLKSIPHNQEQMKIKSDALCLQFSTCVVGTRGYLSYEPRQANLCLQAFRHDKFQLRMPSHSEGPGIWFSV